MALGNHWTAKDAAEHLRVSVGRIYQFVREERLEVAQRVGTIIFFDPAAVKKFNKSPRKSGRPKNKKNAVDKPYERS